ncbi:MAG: hypothetical protein FWE42_03670 [Defluviitaleaceae bacterium]|nr:hypothetical protein [Defluviitaleaceae bacterium]
MSHIPLTSGLDFMDALMSYNSSLAINNHGIIEGASFSDKSSTRSNILVTIIGIIIGAVTGVGFYRTSDAANGSIVLTDDGFHFFTTSTKKVKEAGIRVKKLMIDSHGFIYYDQVKKAITSKSGFRSWQLSLKGTFEDIQGRNIKYSLNIPLSGNDDSIDLIKSKLEDRDITVRKSKAGKIAGVVLLACIAALFFVFFFPSMTSAYREMDYTHFRHEINFPTHSASARYQGRTTSLTARITTDVFTINFDDRSADFVGAAIAGNDRLFLLELGDVTPSHEIGDIVNITAIGMGVVTTRPRPAQSAFDRFFERMGAAFGDPRITGVAADISRQGVLSNRYYLHMRATDMEVAEVVVLGESDTYISAGGNFQITLVDAFFCTTGIGQRQTDIIVIFFDYEALAAHSASRPFNRFVVYQGDEELARSDGGIRSSVADGRGFLATQRVDAGEVFRGMSAVNAANMTDPITVVVYGSGFDMLFIYEMDVR